MTHQCPECDIPMIDEGTIENYTHWCPECESEYILLETHKVWSKITKMEMDWICISCKNRRKKKMKICPICGSDKIGYIRHDRQLKKFKF